MNQQILSQDEVDALLQGITGESQKLEQPRRPPTASAPTTWPARSASCAGACRRWRSSTSASRATSASACSICIRKSPEVSIGGIKVQKYSAFLREIVVPTNFNIVVGAAAARLGADRAATRTWCSR